MGETGTRPVDVDSVEISPDVLEIQEHERCLIQLIEPNAPRRPDALPSDKRASTSETGAVTWTMACQV